MNASISVSSVDIAAHNRCDISHRQGVIWRIFPPPVQAWDISPMSDSIDMTLIRAALSKAMKIKKIAPKRLSIDAGLGETAVRDIMKEDSQDVRVGTLVRLASVLDVQLEDLLGGIKPNERQVQRSILKMIGRSFPSVIAHHSPNGGHLAGSAEARFKQMGALKGDGLKPGFPDLICLWNHGLALIEVKRPGYSPSDVKPAQIALHKELADRGHPVAIVTSEQEAFAYLIERGAPWNRVPV